MGVITGGSEGIIEAEPREGTVGPGVSDGRPVGSPRGAMLGSRLEAEDGTADGLDEVGSYIPLGRVLGWPFFIGKVVGTLGTPIGSCCIGAKVGRFENAGGAVGPPLEMLRKGVML